VSYAIARSYGANADQNKLSHEDRAIHDWYRLVLSFPPHLVRHFLQQFDLGPSDCVLDPFCGTGTTIVEARRLGLPGVGVEGNPLAHFAAEVKVSWDVDPSGLLEHASSVAEAALGQLHDNGISDSGEAVDHLAALPLRTLHPEQGALLLKDSISPLPLHKALTLLDCLQEHHHEQFSSYERLAFAKSVVSASSNLHFGPEVSVGLPKPNAPVVRPWLSAVEAMATDLWWAPRDAPAARVMHGDARQLIGIKEGSIDAVFCSPPYPNEKDYTRATRLESVLLGFIRRQGGLASLEEGSFAVQYPRSLQGRR